MSVLPGTHLNISEVKHVREKCLAGLECALSEVVELSKDYEVITVMDNTVFYLTCGTIT